MKTIDPLELGKALGEYDDDTRKALEIVADVVRDNRLLKQEIRKMKDSHKKFREMAEAYKTQTEDARAASDIRGFAHIAEVDDLKAEIKTLKKKLADKQGG